MITKLNCFLSRPHCTANTCMKEGVNLNMIIISHFPKWETDRIFYDCKIPVQSDSKAVVRALLIFN